MHWIEHYRFDGLRLDAVHALAEPGEPSVLVDISKAVGAFAKRSGRRVHLVLENDDNAASFLDPAADPPAGRYRAQWNDDYHHAWHVLLTGESHGYYRDYIDSTRQKIARSLSDGFIYQGEASPHRKGARRGEPSGDLPPTAFVEFPAEPRSDRQSRARRTARCAGVSGGHRGGAGGDAVGADAGADVHGRGMGLDKAVPVFLRLCRRTGRRRAQRPPRRIRRSLCRSLRSTCPIRWPRKRSARPSSIGTRGTTANHARRLASRQRASCAFDKPRSCR